eukprot:Hpha_TRINITY_DN15726_c2_g1::TRINITY_DN15726_c2_g1_i2::g.40254::m.40254
MIDGSDDADDIFAGCDGPQERGEGAILHVDPVLAPELAEHIASGALAPGTGPLPVSSPEQQPIDGGNFQAVPLDDSPKTGANPPPRNRLPGIANAFVRRVSRKQSQPSGEAAGTAREATDPPVAGSTPAAARLSSALQKGKEQGKRLGAVVSGGISKLQPGQRDREDATAILPGIWCTVRADCVQSVREACAQAGLEWGANRQSLVGVSGRVDQVKDGLAAVEGVGGGIVWWPTEALIRSQPRREPRQFTIRITRKDPSLPFGLRVVESDCEGLRVDGAVPGTAAAACVALAPHIGGLLVAVNDKPVRSTEEVVAVMSAAGTEAVLTVESAQGGAISGASAKARAVGESLRQRQQQVSVALGGKLTGALGRRRRNEDK